jgi:glycosyltransferase involved in cell wall biosynthesis
VNIWIVAAAEPLPMLDGGFRPFRCSLLSSTLAARGHHVTWWTSDYDHMRKAPRFGDFRSIQVQERLSINLVPGPRYHRNISLRRVLHNHVVASRFFARARRSDSPPDVIFACLPTLELAERAVMYGRDRKIPVVVDVRDLWPDLYLRAFPRVLRSAARIALTPEFRRARRILRAADAITAVSPGYLDWALATAVRVKSADDRVFPLGYFSHAQGATTAAGSAREKYGIPANALMVTFVGTFGASYDLGTVVNAAASFAGASAVPIHFVLVGDGDDNQRLRGMAGGAGNITFTGWLNEDDILDLLNTSDVGLAAYGSQAMQSLPNKLFEYIAAGLPVLSSLEGEQRAFVEQHRIGLHYAPHNPSSLIERVTWLSAHPDERRAMGARAMRLFNESYSAGTIYTMLAEYLERLGSRTAATSGERQPEALSNQRPATIA